LLSIDRGRSCRAALARLEQSPEQQRRATGLHFEDVKELLTVLHTLADRGNAVGVIERHLDVVKTADSVIDFGPDGGEAGGRIVAQGHPRPSPRCPPPSPVTTSHPCSACRERRRAEDEAPVVHDDSSPPWVAGPWRRYRP